MEVINLCRICLRSEGGIHKIARCLKPKPNEISRTTIQLYEFLYEVMEASFSDLYDKICKQCLNTIHDMYALLTKCDGATNTLNQTKDASAKKRKLSTRFLKENSIEDSDSSKCSTTCSIDQNKRLTTCYPNMTVDNSIVCRSIVRNNKEIVIAKRDNYSGTVASKELLAKSPSVVGNNLVEILSHDCAAAWEATEEIDSISNYQRKCLLCKQWNHRHQLELHLQFHIAYSSKLFRFEHPRLICPECFFVSEDSFHHDLHMSTHDVLNKYLVGFLCEICGRIFSRSTNFFNHAASHDKYERHQCQVCLKRGFHRSEMTSHILKHIEEYFFNKKGYRHRCRYCGIQYSTRIGLRFHLFEKHGCNEKIVCDICKEELFSEAELSNHNDDFAEKHVCHVCGQKYNCVEEFKSHQLFHLANKRFFCSSCKMSFLGACDLRDHFYLHKICPYQCEYCGRIFCSRTPYFHHVHQHTIENARVSKMKNNDNQIKKKWKIVRKTNSKKRKLKKVYNQKARKNKDMQSDSTTCAKLKKNGINSPPKSKVKKVFRPLRYHPTDSNLVVVKPANNSTLLPAELFEISFLEEEKQSDLAPSSTNTNYDEHEVKKPRQKRDYSRKTTETAPPNSAKIFESDKQKLIPNSATNSDDIKPEQLETIDLEIKDTASNVVGITIDVNFDIFENEGFD